MQESSPEQSQQAGYPQGSYQLPSYMADELRDSVQLVKVLTEHDTFLDIIRREMRGEQLYQDESGEASWVQVDKPMFVKLDRHDKPIRKFNDKTKREEYIANDDAVNEVLSILKNCGLNPITPLTNINEEEIRADLLEMESKVAVLLAVKRKEWGIDKAGYPAAVGKIKILIKDARYRAKDGTVLKALRTITSRIEQATDHVGKKTMGERMSKMSPYR